MILPIFFSNGKMKVVGMTLNKDYVSADVQYIDYSRLFVKEIRLQGKQLKLTLNRDTEDIDDYDLPFRYFTTEDPYFSSNKKIKNLFSKYHANMVEYIEQLCCILSKSD
jgi:hypothetical protein